MSKKALTEENILDALKRNDGNQRKAAESLAVSQAWLTRWLKKNKFFRCVTWEKGGAA